MIFKNDIFKILWKVKDYASMYKYAFAILTTLSIHWKLHHKNSLFFEDIHLICDRWHFYRHFYKT